MSKQDGPSAEAMEAACEIAEYYHGERTGWEAEPWKLHTGNTAAIIQAAIDAATEAANKDADEASECIVQLDNRIIGLQRERDEARASLKQASSELDEAGNLLALAGLGASSNMMHSAAAKHAALLAEPCQHEWVSMRNVEQGGAVESGEMCPKCNAVRAEPLTDYLRSFEDQGRRDFADSCGRDVAPSPYAPAERQAWLRGWEKAESAVEPEDRT